ncbi:hypothetical protein Acr_22g0008950 [Actinidia rufa]|uniref:non-specific serine/threonine protein kinase n=1 Tax=Actinidia rufa TaxID=165716 RepID=A0A7J0GL02_9ERIC|nr:hypothetical protein Acr_22g0008950 [Actinidia rufa]
MSTSMASFGHHLLSLFLFTTLLSTSINGNSVNPSNTTCPSFDCGNGLVVGYPFWQQGRQNDHCGYQGLGILCTGRQPLLCLSGDIYRLKKINHSENTLTATYNELNNTTCPVAHHDVKLNSSYFLNISMENKVVRLFYNCTLYPPSLPYIECLRYGLKRSYVFGEGAIPEFDWERYCETTVSVPVIEKGGDGILVNSFGRALQDGFMLTWRSPDRACRSCEASGGFCGYGNGLLQKFICYCNDGQQSDNSCHHNGNFLCMI